MGIGAHACVYVCRHNWLHVYPCLGCICCMPMHAPPPTQAREEAVAKREEAQKAHAGQVEEKEKGVKEAEAGAKVCAGGVGRGRSSCLARAFRRLPPAYLPTCI
jgi:hypothetical protein